MVQIIDEHSLLIQEIGLWLDHRSVKPYGFVSHAHADHFAHHQRILCSPETAAILKKRYRVPKSRLQSVEYHSPITYKGHVLELLPAGHITGSAMLHITREKDGATLLFTGDFKTRPSHTAREIGYKKADHLIMESTFGKPHYTMPPTEKSVSQLVNFVDSSLQDGFTPILMAYSLGKAQEAHYLLGENHIAPVLHPAVAKISSECIRLRMKLPDFYYLDELCPERHCIIMPPGARKSNYLASIGPHRTAMLTGWALDNPRPSRYHDIDELIPLSDHADYPSLIAFAQAIEPKKITTVHGFTTEFAADLCKLGFDAYSANQ